MNLEKAGLFVLIAILVGGLGSSPVFNSSYSAFASSHESDEEHDEMDHDEMEETETDERRDVTACTLEYAPVCGEDGKTYGNMCMLESSDVDLAYEGECEGDVHDDYSYSHCSGCVCDEHGECDCGDHGMCQCEGGMCDCRDGTHYCGDRHMSCDCEDGKCDCGEEGMCHCEDGKCDCGEHGMCNCGDGTCSCGMHQCGDDEMHCGDDGMCSCGMHHDKMGCDCVDGSCTCGDRHMSCDCEDGKCDCGDHGMCSYADDGMWYCGMHDKMKEKHHDMKMKHMMKHDYKITDERKDHLKMKFREMHSDLSDAERDEIRSELKAKYDRYYEMKLKHRHDAMSDHERDDILKRHSEMRDYKMELREKYDTMTDEERDQYRMDFFSKVMDMSHAWISPRIQMKAGISPDQIECREGLNLVIMESNGKPMCMKASTAEKLIERGVIVPAS